MHLSEKAPKISCHPDKRSDEESPMVTLSLLFTGSFTASRFRMTAYFWWDRIMLDMAKRRKKRRKQGRTLRIYRNNAVYYILFKTSVILRSGATKNPVNRTASVTIRGPSLAFMMTAALEKTGRSLQLWDRPVTLLCFQPIGDQQPQPQPQPPSSSLPQPPQPPPQPPQPPPQAPASSNMGSCPVISMSAAVSASPQ